VGYVHEHACMVSGGVLVWMGVGVRVCGCGCGAGGSGAEGLHLQQREPMACALCVP